MRLVKFTYDDDGNECGLAVEFTHRAQRMRNAVVLSRLGINYNALETANALRTLARWCETIGYNERRKFDGE